nr:retrovirus-related Pol polyprotein from transposon TNT 1-94 [Tanacetum cinerariifolium]
DDGLFLGYSLGAKAFRIPNFRRQEIEEPYHVTFNEADEVIKTLEEEGWVIATQDELNQFERYKVWTLVLTPYGKTIIGTKWIFRNKMNENGVVIRKKQVARLEVIRIFLAYAAYVGFVVYQMDVKSAFLNGKLSEEVYVQQSPGFESSEFPNYVCKALYELKQVPRAWY